MVNIFKNPDELLLALSDFIVAKAGESIGARGRFNFVLSGGSSPKALYQLLASAYQNKIEWGKVFFFFGDERHVPLDHESSNFLMARHTLFEPLRIGTHQVFAVNTSLPPASAARVYEKRIKQHFGGAVCAFDLVLLGLGDNSHTASLFPHTSVLHEKESLVKEVYVEEVKMDRITFTAPLINAAHNIAFLVYGASKAIAVRNILKGPTDTDAFPAQLIHPTQGNLDWFLDEAAGESI